MIEVILRVRLDPDVVTDVERFRDIAERPVVAVRDLDVDEKRVGDAVLAILRAATGV